MKWFTATGRALLDAVYPPRCAACGAERTAGAWCGRGPRVRGLRWWDETQLCSVCYGTLRGDPVLRRSIGTGAGALRVWAGAATGPVLAGLVGAWKYHGQRGLAWPLAGLLLEALRTAHGGPGPDDLLVPVPLHRARRRARGFNQAAVLARLLEAAGSGRARTDLLRRERATGQQAKLTDEAARAENLAGAFRCVESAGGRSPDRVFLVDDLVTSGATAASAAVALHAAGWRCAGVLAPGAVPAGADLPGAAG